MDFKNSIKNAYPVVNLHDCCLSNIRVETNRINILFEDGVGLDAEEQSGKAEICINTMAENAIFLISKRYRFIKGSKPFYISKSKSLVNLKSMFKKGYSFEIVEEYYSDNRFLWKGEIFCHKNGKRRSKGYFEFMCYFEKGVDLIYNFN